MFSGQKLKEIREAQGMSQAAVAKHLGISRRTRSRKAESTCYSVILL